MPIRFPFVKRAFETIALAKVATSAEEARTLGFLAEDDTISMNGDRLIADAKKEVLALAASGYVQPQQRTDILALGNPALATLKLGIHQMKRGGYISDHDAVIGEKLARILTGGDLNHETRVSEQYLLDLEREAFLSLAGTRKTQERLAAMLKTGKAVEELEKETEVKNQNQNNCREAQKPHEDSPRPLAVNCGHPSTQ